MSIYGRPEHKYPGIKAIGPAWIRCSGKLFILKQLIYITQYLQNRKQADFYLFYRNKLFIILQKPQRSTYKCVCIQEHTFAVLGKSPAMELREGDPQFRTSQPGEMSLVSTVQNIYHNNLIKHIRQGQPRQCMEIVCDKNAIIVAMEYYESLLSMHVFKLLHF